MHFLVLKVSSKPYKMGNNIASGYRLYMHPDVTPAPNEKSKFDPLYGFPEGRERKGNFLKTCTIFTKILG